MSDIESETALTRARYQRLAPLYDLMETGAELFYRPWRRCLWSLVKGPCVLEVGVGTGKNMSFYPDGVEVVGVDLTPAMLERAQKRAAALKLDVELQMGDAQALDFPADSFDDAVATFVFCSVPDPPVGLNELHRVVKPGGQVLLLEHVRAANVILGALMEVTNPIVVRAIGANINRRTVENVRRSNLRVERVEDLGWGGIYKLIVARTTL